MLDKLNNSEGKIRVWSGIMIDPLNPQCKEISINDIAHGLSMICRFGGHTRYFYSVAEHSIKVSYLVEKEDKLAALLHDASEAYMLDIPSPIKNTLHKYKRAEDKLMALIAEKYKFKYPLNHDIKTADQIMLHDEWHVAVLGNQRHDSMTSTTGMTPAEAKKEFLKLFNEYNKL